ncbi:MAG TPA: tetratricopeptide repeat protein [Spirochaetales bacterium]|nr:tetratricopeptide repeat protein [Spirochaetales bacterium]HQK33398.1 tetratricopeptide repeat protein [Spirochaetales bacterium]
MKFHCRVSVNFLTVLLIVFILTACVSTQPVKTKTATETALPVVQKSFTVPSPLELLLIRGGPQDLLKAKDLCDRDTGLSDNKKQFYRWLILELARLIYPDISGTDTAVYPIASDDTIARHFIDARNGILIELQETATPLDYIVSMTGIFRQLSTALINHVEQLIKQFRKFGLESVIVSLIEGIIQEQRKNYPDSLKQYTKAYEMDEQCYPALYGSMRMLLETNQPEIVLQLLDKAQYEFKSSLEGKRYRALALFALGRYKEADPLIAEVLKVNTFDSKFILMKARIQIEAGNYREAVTLLTAYSKVNQPNAEYYLLQARITAEFIRNISEAKVILRSALVQYPDNFELLVYFADLLSTGTLEEQNEALVYVQKLIVKNSDSKQVVKIMLTLLLNRGNYAEALLYADKLLAVTSGFVDYELIIRAYRLAGKIDAAERLTDTWLAADPNSETASLFKLYIMIDKKIDKQVILEQINRLLQQKNKTSMYRSNLYVLQSQFLNTIDDKINALRLALVENNTNINALLALYDIYFAQKDYQRARFYLLQAYSLSPDSTEVTVRREKIGQVGFKVP